MAAPDFDVIKDIPGFKVIFTTVLKAQIQQLVKQLAEYTNEESVILTASVSDGTISLMGSDSGKGFLEEQENVKTQFLSSCLKRHHQKLLKEKDRERQTALSAQAPLAGQYGYWSSRRRHPQMPYHTSPRQPFSPQGGFSVRSQRHEPYPILRPNRRSSFTESGQGPLSSPLGENVAMKTEPSDTDNLEGNDSVNRDDDNTNSSSGASEQSGSKVGENTEDISEVDPKSQKALAAQAPLAGQFDNGPGPRRHPRMPYHTSPRQPFSPQGGFNVRSQRHEPYPILRPNRRTSFTESGQGPLSSPLGENVAMKTEPSDTDNLEGNDSVNRDDDNTNSSSGASEQSGSKVGENTEDISEVDPKSQKALAAQAPLAGQFDNGPGPRRHPRVPYHTFPPQPFSPQGGFSVRSQRHEPYPILRPNRRTSFTESGQGPLSSPPGENVAMKTEPSDTDNLEDNDSVDRDDDNTNSYSGASEQSGSKVGENTEDISEVDPKSHKALAAQAPLAGQFDNGPGPRRHPRMPYHTSPRQPFSPQGGFNVRSQRHELNPILRPYRRTSFTESGQGSISSPLYEHVAVNTEPIDSDNQEGNESVNRDDDTNSSFGASEQSGCKADENTEDSSEIHPKIVKVQAISESNFELQSTGVEPGLSVPQDNSDPDWSVGMNFNLPQGASGNMTGADAQQNLGAVNRNIDQDQDISPKPEQSHRKLKPGQVKQTSSQEEAERNRKQALRMQKVRLLKKLKVIAKKFQEQCYEPVDTLFIVKEHNKSKYTYFGSGNMVKKFEQGEVIMTSIKEKSRRSYTEEEPVKLPTPNKYSLTFTSATAKSQRECQKQDFQNVSVISNNIQVYKNKETRTGTTTCAKELFAGKDRTRVPVQQRSGTVSRGRRGRGRGQRLDKDKTSDASSASDIVPTEQHAGNRGGRGLRRGNRGRGRKRKEDVPDSDLSSEIVPTEKHAGNRGGRGLRRGNRGRGRNAK